MYEQIDEKARKLLKKVCWWKREDIFTEEEIQYGIEKGVFFQPITLHHDDVIAEIQTRANEIELKEAVNAFLYSLSTGELRYRTILSSVFWGRKVTTHEVCGEIPCSVCEMPVDKNTKISKIDLNVYNRYRYYSGEQDIHQAGYVLLDLKEYLKLPKVNYTSEDIRILNRIFGLAEELASGNKAVALQKLITSEKFFKTSKNEINGILGVLSTCGVFETPEHQSVTTKFIPNYARGFATESDWCYPLNYWRGKYGVNYDAVQQIFAPVVGNLLDREHAILGKARREDTAPKKKSKAEQYFTEGQHFVEISNEERYYYGLHAMDEKWEKITTFSVTHCIYKRTEIYFEGNMVKKLIYEEFNEAQKMKYYHEIDMNVETIERKMVLPKTKRGKAKPLTSALLRTSTYMDEQLMVKITNDEDSYYLSSFNSSNAQMLPLPLGNISNQAEKRNL